jgi:hypothetical protein
MRYFWITLFCFITGCTPGNDVEPPTRSSHGNNVESPNRRVDVVIPHRLVTFEGRWRTVSQTGSTSIPRLNTATGHCEKATMTCSESIAKLYGKNEWPGRSNGFLRVANTDFRVIEWSKDRVVARYEAPVADIEIRISLSDGSAERSFRETKARGSETADSKIAGHWVLE